MEIQMFSSSLGAMGSLLGKLRSLLVSPEDQLPEPLKPHKDKLEQLEQDLEEINTLLMDLSKGEDPNTMAKLWMNEVRDLSYDIEDSVDKTMRPNTYTGEEIPFEVEEFHTLVKQASDARKRYYRYNLGRWASNPTFGVDGRARVVPNMDLVGIGDSRDKLVNLIGVGDEAEQRMKVVSVLGPVGVGKTTLAKEVYRQIRGKFECRAFVRASKMPDTRRLLRNIISQVQHHHRPSHGLPVQELIDNLRKHLQQKRYLILIDGLWETTSWDIVNSAFPEGNHCSRILITTDIEEVALDCCDYQSEGIFKMELLSRNNSRVLLFNKMFGPKHECSEALKEASEEVVQNCGGLPLATICIAGILASQPDNSELWQSVNERLSCCMRNNLTSEDMLREIISMSYNSLSNHLKTCLLYLSMYPEGYTFLKTDLVKQWSAEGFISAVEGKDNSEVAEFYFDDLVCRGLVQPNCIDFSDEVMFYTVHSTVFEVLRCKSMEENFTTVIDYSEAITKLSAKVRRLSLTFSSAKYATKPEGIALSEVRSLTFYGLVKCLPSIIEFKLLRVLILEFWGDKEELDMGGINKLFQLRYLQITTDMTIKLPASMQELIYLETIEMYARIVTFPSDAFDLPRLWHLCLQDVVNLPDGIGHMRSLRTLQSFDLSRNSSKNVRSLNELTNLRDLHLTCSTASFGRQLKRNLLSLVFSLEKLGNLKSIVLAPAASCTSINFFCADNVSLPVSLQRLELLPPICIFPRLPLCIGQLQKLRSLKIVLRELTRSDIYSMGRLQELTILSLYVWRPTAGFIVFSPGAFPVLKSFKFRCGIMRLGFQADAIPSLQRLKLEFNAHTGEKNANVLAGIEHLLNLQELTGRIGAAPGAEESDRKAAEALFKDTIIKHSRLTSFNLRIVHLFDKETSQFASTPASCTTSDCKHKWPSMDDGIGELNKGAVVQEFSSFCNASSTSNLDLPKYQASVTEPWNHPLASEPLDAWPMEWPMGSLFQLPIPPTHGSEQQLSKDKQPGDNMPSHSQNQLSDDGYRWHMYGEEVMNKGSRNVRSYYWCTFSGCAVRKNVERSQDGQQIVEIMYDGTHNHAKPHDTSRGGSGSSGTAGEQLRRQSGAAGSEASGHTFGGNNNSMIPARSPRSGSDRLDEHDRDPKKWRKDGDDGGISIAGKRVREPRVVTQTMSDSDIIDDGFRWRKYGQKDVKGGNPRSYYRCTTAGCPARKHVERASHDQRVVITTYKGKHNHIAPPAPGDS